MLVYQRVFTDDYCLSISVYHSWIFLDSWTLALISHHCGATRVSNLETKPSLGAGASPRLEFGRHLLAILHSFLRLGVIFTAPWMDGKMGGVDGLVNGCMS